VIFCKLSRNPISPERSTGPALRLGVLPKPVTEFDGVRKYAASVPLIPPINLPPRPLCLFLRFFYLLPSPLSYKGESV